MRQSAGGRWMERFRSIRSRPLLAVLISILSLAVIGGAALLTTPLRCGPGRALGLSRGCITVGGVAGRPSPSPNGNPASAPYPTFSYPASGPYPNPASGPYGNPASGPYPYPASGSYPPFYPPATSASGAIVPTRAVDCRLPVYAGPPGSGGFIVFPGGSFIADPASSVAAPSPTPTPASGPGYGYSNPGLSYDRAFSRWLPVPASWVSPDGSRYAFTGSDGVYVVNVANGTQTELGGGQAWYIVTVQNQGVYAGNPGIAGLWLLPFSGSPRQITTTGYWQAGTASAAYGTVTSAVPSGASNGIIRLDLKTGATSDWFARPGTISSVTGFDGKGDPILQVNYISGGNEIWITISPTTASPIAGIAFSPYNSGGFSANGAPIADSHGIWFAGNFSSPYGGGSATGIALYVAGSGLYWMSSIGGQLAGACS
jgi:hypothetical protein